MIVRIRPGATPRQVRALEQQLMAMGMQVHRIPAAGEGVLCAVTPGEEVPVEKIASLPAVERVDPIKTPFKLASRAYCPAPTTIRVGAIEIGGREPVLMAGPCAVESEEQLFLAARAVRAEGATVLRGGAFKPRSSPYSFQGLGVTALKILRQAADELGMAVVSEIMDVSQLDDCLRYVDILQVGARNVQNFTLLQALGRIDRPVLLKRGMSSTIDEWLMSAEYIMSGGNYKVLICERGIRTYNTHTRNTLDLSAVPVAKDLSHLPVIVDPSHGVGIRDMILPMARAAIAAGADGLLIEVHPHPEAALSDGPQSLYPEQFAELARQVREIARVVGRVGESQEEPSAREKEN
jgi:3-deoxy-7-phosphoheptulonate synthase